MIGVSSFRSRGFYLIPVESPVGPRRAQACSSGLPCGHNTLDSPVWLIAFILGACLEVLFLSTTSGAMY